MELEGLLSVGTLLWPTLKARIAVSEVDEVAMAIGLEAIETNQQLFDEREALVFMAQTILEANSAAVKRMRLCNSPQRLLLEDDIRLLVARLTCLSMGPQCSSSPAPNKSCHVTISCIGCCTPPTSASTRSSSPNWVLADSISSRSDRRIVNYLHRSSSSSKQGLLTRPPTASPSNSKPLSSNQFLMSGCLGPRPSTSSSGSSTFSRSSSLAPTGCSSHARLAPGATAAVAGEEASDAAPGAGGAVLASGGGAAPAQGAHELATDAAPSMGPGPACHEDLMQQLPARLSVESVRGVLPLVQSALTAEGQGLMADLATLQQLLEEQVEVQAQGEPPAVADLLDCSKRLRAEVQQHEVIAVLRALNQLDEAQDRIGSSRAHQQSNSGQKPQRLRSLMQAARSGSGRPL